MIFWIGKIQDLHCYGHLLVILDRTQLIITASSAQLMVPIIKVLLLNRLWPISQIKIHQVNYPEKRFWQ